MGCCDRQSPVGVCWGSKVCIVTRGEVRRSIYRATVDGTYMCKRGTPRWL